MKLYKKKCRKCRKMTNVNWMRGTPRIKRTLLHCLPMILDGEVYLLPTYSITPSHPSAYSKVPGLKVFLTCCLITIDCFLSNVSRLSACCTYMYPCP